MGEAQGKKVDPSAIAVQAIEAQPAFGQIKPMRGKVLACTEQHSRRRASYQSVRTRDPGASGKEEKTWRTERRPSVDETERTNDDAPSLQDYHPPTGSSPPVRSDPARAAIISRSRTTSAFRSIASREKTEPDDHPSVVTDPKDGPRGDGAEPAPTPSPRAGVASIATRAQAVHPTTTAPTKANASRHHSEVMPI
jgi:hypothetical protein